MMTPCVRCLFGHALLVHALVGHSPFAEIGRAHV